MGFASTGITRPQDTAGIRLRRLQLYTGPASYATGGEAITAASLKLGAIEHLPDFFISNGTDLRLMHWDRDNALLKAFVPDTNAEVANTSDLSTFTGVAEIIGR